MKKFFYAGLAGLLVFEVLRVYFIMPMPGSQRSQSLDTAYFLHQWRWEIRALFGVCCALGLAAALRPSSRKSTIALLATGAAVVWLFNGKFSADHMFLEPESVRMLPAASSKVPGERLVMGLVMGREARAYPIQYLAYHHQVRDTVAGTPVLVTYCSVCRTGRVFASLIDGEPETFRLVGMDHFNAMFEDSKTGTWWRQVNGEAVAGPLKGTFLPEIQSFQTTLSQWLKLYPNARILQADPAAEGKYSKDLKYEKGASRDELTGTDPDSWKDKSWVVGVQAGTASKAYDWNRLKKERIVNDWVGKTPVVLVLASDTASFAAFQRPDDQVIFSLSGDSLKAPGYAFDLMGRSPSGRLRALPASQEFWHSWKTFQPSTARY